MKLVDMRPEELRDAVARDVPVLLVMPTSGLCRLMSPTDLIGGPKIGIILDVSVQRSGPHSAPTPPSGDLVGERYALETVTIGGGLPWLATS